MSIRHKALRIVFAAAISAGGLLATTAAPAFADSRGNCDDSSTYGNLNGNYRAPDPPSKPDGTPAQGYERVYGDISVDNSTSFGPCTPDDNAGTNGPSAWVGVVRRDYLLNPHVQAGIFRGVNCPGNPSWCDGTPHLWSEWKSGTGISTVRDLGPASYGRTYTVLLDIQVNEIDVYFDGNFKTTWVVGGELNVSDPLTIQWMAETHDRGDGLGDSTHGSTDIGSMKYRVKYGTGDYLIWNRSADCNWDTSPLHTQSDLDEIKCYPNGSYSLYFRTLN